jgi:ADP-heptose:LPS heptosyltransferase
MVHSSDPFWDRSPGYGKGRFWDFIQTVIEIRSEKYDLAVVLNAEWRRSLFCLLAGIPIRLGYDRRKSKIFLTHPIPCFPKDSHFVDEHRFLIERFLRSESPLEKSLPRLEVNEEEQKRWQAWSDKTGWKKGDYLVIHPFSGDVYKSWPQSCWLELMEKIAAEFKETKFVVVCGPGEARGWDWFHSSIKRKNIEIWEGRNLSDIKGILGGSQMFLGGDSGPAHMASALGVPVVSLFGPTNPERSAPTGYSSLKLLRKDPIRYLEVNEVFHAVQEILSNRMVTV